MGLNAVLSRLTAEERANLQRPDVEPVMEREVVKLGVDRLGRQWYRVECSGCDSAAIEGLDPEALKGRRLCISCSAPRCGKDNERLVRAGYRFDACHREPGHPGQHEYWSL